MLTRTDEHPPTEIMDATCPPPGDLGGMIQWIRTHMDPKRVWPTTTPTGEDYTTFILKTIIQLQHYYEERLPSLNRSSEVRNGLFLAPLLLLRWALKHIDDKFTSQRDRSIYQEACNGTRSLVGMAVPLWVYRKRWDTLLDYDSTGIPVKLVMSEWVLQRDIVSSMSPELRRYLDLPALMHIRPHLFPEHPYLDLKRLKESFASTESEALLNFHAGMKSLTFSNINTPVFGLLLQIMHFHKQRFEPFSDENCAIEFCTTLAKCLKICARELSLYADLDEPDCEQREVREWFVLEHGMAYLWRCIHDHLFYDPRSMLTTLIESHALIDSIAIVLFLCIRWSSVFAECKTLSPIADHSAESFVPFGTLNLLHGIAFWNTRSVTSTLASLPESEGLHRRLHSEGVTFEHVQAKFYRAVQRRLRKGGFWRMILNGFEKIESPPQYKTIVMKTWRSFGEAFGFSG